MQPIDQLLSTSTACQNISGACDAFRRTVTTLTTISSEPLDRTCSTMPLTTVGDLSDRINLNAS